MTRISPVAAPPLGGGPTIFVAASDALASSIAMAAPEYRCDGTADDVQIQAAIDALPAGGGKVVLSEGTFTLTSAIAITSPGISLRGSGLATIIVPTAVVGIAVTGGDRCDIGNFAITGGTLGLSIAGATDSIFHEIYLNAQTIGGILVDGDASTETTFRDITMRDVEGIGFDYVRTNTDDTGGLYLDRVRTIRGTDSTFGFSFESAAVSETAIFVFMSQCVADGYTDTALHLKNVAHVRVGQSWFTSSGTTCVDIDECFAITIDGGTSMSGGAANEFVLTLQGSSHEIILNDVMFGGACEVAIDAVSGINNIYIGQYHNFADGGNAELANGDEIIYGRAGSNLRQGPVEFMTRGSGGSTDVISIADSEEATGKDKYIRNNNGTLEFLNTAFGAVILSLADSGLLSPVDMKQTGANLGFYNHATTTQQVLATGSSVDDVITALQTLGLVKQS